MFNNRLSPGGATDWAWSVVPPELGVFIGHYFRWFCYRLISAAPPAQDLWINQWRANARLL